MVSASADCSVDFVYCSHVLEHSLPAGISAAPCVRRTASCGRTVCFGGAPTWIWRVRRYLSSDAPDACSQFMQVTAPGAGESRRAERRASVGDRVGNSRHLWTGFPRLESELARAGFKDCRRRRLWRQHRRGLPQREQRRSLGRLLDSSAASSQQEANPCRSSWKLALLFVLGEVALLTSPIVVNIALVLCAVWRAGAARARQSRHVALSVIVMGSNEALVTPVLGFWRRSRAS